MSLDPSPAEPTPTIQQWRTQRTLLHSIAISVLILTGTFFVFLFRQVDTVRKNTREMVGFINQYERSETAEVIYRVQRELDSYRKQNPAFNPIYVKYFGTNSPPPPTLSSKVTATNNAPGRTN